MRVGIIGAGTISAAYLKSLTQYPDVEVVAIGDLDAARAQERAAEFGVPAAGTSDAALANPDVELVCNLTIPAVHVDVSQQAIQHGLHVWSEKPLGLTRDSARSLLDAADSAGLRVGCAPDTVLGPGVQTVLRRLAAGEIGRPFSGLAMFTNAGPDLWHPSPEFLFAVGGGPTLDIGPYYLTALVLALGPVVRVSAAGGRAREVRTIREGPRAGQRFPVEVPTTVNAVLEHASGASSAVVFSFDSAKRHIGVLEFSGPDGTIASPDPNYFGGTLELYRPGEDEPEQVEIDAENIGRGTGIVDMVRSLREGTMHRANGELAYHVLDVMLALQSAVEEHESFEIASRPPIVPPVPDGWTPLG